MKPDAQYHFCDVMSNEGTDFSLHMIMLSRLRCTKCTLVAAKYNTDTGIPVHVLSHDKMGHVRSYCTVNRSSYRKS